MSSVSKWVSKYFKPSEFKHPDKLNPELLKLLDAMREKAGKPFIIHSDYREGDPGFHGKGLAVDGHFEGMSLIDQFLLAMRYFNGVGMYPHWNSPGIHCDCRPIKVYQPRVMWGAIVKDGTQRYIPLDKDFIEKTLRKEI